MIQKELDSLSLPITELDYRNLPDLSYSNLSSFEKLGFNGIDKLFDHKDTPSLRFGSMVDTILTDGMEEFNSRFVVTDFPKLGEKELLVVTYLFDNYGKTYPTIGSMPITIIEEAVEINDYNKNFKLPTRVNKIITNCSSYYKALVDADNKIIVSPEDYNDAINCVKTLKESPATRGYFADNDESSPIRRYYQLKFQTVLENISFKCMFDLLIVDYEDKIIYPIDLKTSTPPEWDFHSNFATYNYQIQARLYSRILKDKISKDSYFKDFKIADFKFIVISRYTLTPIVWEFPYTFEEGTFIDDKNKIHRDPIEIAKELTYYLDNHPKVPMGIDMTGTNTITCLKKIELTA